MARTKRNTAPTAEIDEPNIVPIQPGIEEQAPVDQPNDEPTPVGELDEQPEADDDQAEAEPRSYGGPSLNRVELIGRIAKDPDLRYTRSGMPMVYFRVATNGLKPEDTEFHQCTAFGKTASFIGEYLSTGRLVQLDGRLQTRAYDDRDGVRRWATTITVNRLQALDFRLREQQ